MTFLSPWSVLFAAAIALPALLLLYFLKLRRQSLRIPSTLLWQKSFEDLQVNAPFQRLRWSLLLVLQLLVLLLLLTALGDPVLRSDEVGSRRVVLLIDRSASMNALLPSAADAKTQLTRLDSAKRIARDYIERIGRGTGPEEIMIISFGRNAEVVSGFTSDRRSLLELLEAIEPTDDQSDLDSALQLAGAFLGSRDESEELSPPAVVLISDGNIAPSTEAEGHRLRAGRFTFVQAVPGIEASKDETSNRNVGFTALGARRDAENPEQVAVFARLINVGSEPVDAVISIHVDDQPVASVLRRIPAVDGSLPGESFLSQQIDAPGAATIVLRHNFKDDLPADNVAALVIPAPSRPRVLLVHPTDQTPDPFLHDLLEAAELQRLDPVSKDSYEVREQSAADMAHAYDLIVFDRVDVSRLPGTPTLSVGAVPAPLRSEAASSDEGRHVLSWDRQHALMRNVALDTVVYSGFGSYTAPSSAIALALGPEGPIIVAFQTRGVRHVAVGFEMVRSNWPLHISSAVFLQNLIDSLPGRASGGDELTYQSGETISVRALPQTERLDVAGPLQLSLSASPGAMVNLPPLAKSGVYTIRGAAPPHQTVAVNVLSDVESDIRPRSSVEVNAQSSRAQRAAGVARLALWPWLVALAFALMVVEWLVYCRRSRGF